MRTIIFGSIMVEAHRRHTETIKKKLFAMMKRNNCECQEDTMFIPTEEWDEFRKWCRNE